MFRQLVRSDHPLRLALEQSPCESFRLPDASLLTRFRGRLGAEGFQQIFQQLVAIARAEGLVKDRLRLKDASHVIAKIVTCFTVNVKRMVKLLTSHTALSSARGVGFE